MSDISIKSLTAEHARQAAQLHITGIPTGFISSLGIDFVTALYKAIAASKYGYGFVAQMEGRVVGFSTFATDLNGLYRSAIFSNGLRFVSSLAIKMLSPRNLKRAVETLLYPARIEKLDLPSAEFLSMVIAEEARGKGLATEMVRRGFAEAERRGIDKLKILAAVSIKPINKMYEKFGFDRVGQIENHGVLSNIYVARTNHFDRNCPSGDGPREYPPSSENPSSR